MKKLSIYDYSLYNCPLEIDFSPKLNIVYGTNGTGKSTLLMLILFSIIGPYKGGIKTGIRKEQRRDTRPFYGESFFKDRAVEQMDGSKVISKFIINKDEYEVIHSLANGKLVSVLVNGIPLSGKDVSYRTYEQKYSKYQDTGNEKELREYLVYNYHESLKHSTGLPGGVNTLISMLLDVMFFSEKRSLTFLDPDLQETIIGKYIVDADFYERYCEQKLNTKALESAYKKASETWNYMHKFFKKEKEEKELAGEEPEVDLRLELNNIENEIIYLEQSRSEDQSLYERKNSDLLSLSRKEEVLKEELSLLEDKWYSNLFPSQYDTYYKRFSNHMLDGICPICGSNHSFKMKTEYCIMCEERLQLKERPDLVTIDIERKNKQNELLQMKSAILQVREELSLIKNRIDKGRKQISEKSIRKNEIEVRLKPNKDLIEDSDTRRLDKAKADRDNVLAVFNESKKEEEKMKKIIEESLVDNFHLFQTSFIKYAVSFFGNMHDVKLYLPFTKENSLDELMIKFILDGKDREEDYMLSESQRIFTDLAFRFAILTTFHDDSFFMCETPDSTLDMFHEENAVKTFETFIEQGNSLILTGNARKSKLITELYHRYGADEVKVIDLTEVSKLALDRKYNFKSYIGGFNHEP